MNSDIRIKIGFHRHPKIQKLRKELGDAGPLSLIILWGYVAQNRPDGNLAGMSVEDIELAAEWKAKRRGSSAPFTPFDCLIRPDGVTQYMTGLNTTHTPPPHRSVRRKRKRPQ